jgi:AAA domain
VTDAARQLWEEIKQETGFTGPEPPPDDPSDDGQGPDQDPVPDPPDPEADQPPPAPPVLEVRSVAAALANPPEEPDVLVNGLLRRGEMCVFGAGRALGKTWLGFNLAHQLSQGDGLFLGTLRIQRAARVLYCQGELDPWGSYDRWRKLVGDTPAPEVMETFDRWRLRTMHRRMTWQGDGFTTSETHVDAVLDGRVEQTIIEGGYEVLFIDPWKVYFAGNENSNDEVEAALDKLRDLVLRHGLTVVILTHISKALEVREPEDLWRGASRLADWASTRVTLIPHYTEQQAAAQGMTRQQARRYVDVRFLRRSDPTEDFSIAWNQETGWWERWEAGDQDDGQGPTLTVADLIQVCRKIGGSWASRATAAKDLGVNIHKATVLLEQAVREGSLESFKGPRNAVGYRLWEGTL